MSIALKRTCLLLLLATGAPCVADTTATADLIITNGRVLTMDASRSSWDAGVVVIRGDTIVAVGDSQLLQTYRSDAVIDAGGDIVMPGMVNLHNHLPMVAFRGLGENNFKDRLFNVMFPLEKALLSRELIRVAARQAALESALAGVTTVTDMYYHEDEVARSVAEVGIRGVLGETVIGFPVVDAAEPYGGLAYAERFIAEWQGHDLITPAVAPHAPYTVSPEWLQKSRALAERKAHAARQPFEQPETQLLLQRPDLVADGSGRHVELTGCGGKTAVPGRRLEGPEPGDGGQLVTHGSISLTDKYYEAIAR